MSNIAEPFTLARYVSQTAPGGLALVQGLLNTRSTASGAVDLLDDRAGAQRWLTAGLTEWGSRTGSTPRSVRLDEAALASLRELRENLRRYVSGDRESARLHIEIAIVSRPDGALRTQPTGDVIDWVASAAWGAVLMAQELGTLPRLKLCRNELCGSAFYDRSKNSSGVWHDVRTCGNIANLRASRARRKAPAI